MVCKGCEKKLHKHIVADVWKDGARNTKVGSDRKVNPNMALGASKLKKTKKEQRINPLFHKCKICKVQLHDKGYYCNGCAYSKGICSMCGKKVLDTSSFKMTS
eukprot:g71401.t1